ncbi:MAG: MaoC family dehydratase N-terminal domain-containing protein [Alphaproteobacteria bacterium]
MTEATLDNNILQTWIGRQETDTDIIHTRQARLMQALLDHDPALQDDDPLPPLWHWVYFPVPAQPSQMGLDGHLKLGGFLPPVDLPRRMWAGGKVTIDSPVLLGETIRRTSTIKSVEVKNGRSGQLCFVTVQHDFTGDDGAIRFSEQHDIVYRDQPAPDAPPPKPVPPPQDADWSEIFTPTSVLLFRFSALTYNGHRIHYDRDYARNEEGYPGLVFHGPLTVTLLTDRAIGRMPGRTLKHLSYRAMAPLFDTHPFALNGKSDDSGDSMRIWAETPDGGLAMDVTATFAAELPE